MSFVSRSLHAPLKCKDAGVCSEKDIYNSYQVKGSVERSSLR